MDAARFASLPILGNPAQWGQQAAAASDLLAGVVICERRLDAFSRAMQEAASHGRWSDSDLHRGGVYTRRALDGACSGWVQTRRWRPQHLQRILFADGWLPIGSRSSAKGPCTSPATAAPAAQHTTVNTTAAQTLLICRIEYAPFAQVVATHCNPPSRLAAFTHCVIPLPMCGIFCTMGAHSCGCNRRNLVVVN